jgi:hypothetical protein
MLVSLFAANLNPLFHDSAHYRRGIDFYSIYQSGDALLSGHSIYKWPNTSHVPYSFPFRYLPFVAYAIAVPMNLIPPEPAYWLWVIAIEIMLTLNAVITYRLARERGWGLIAAALWFAYTPFYLEIYLGQWSFLMATLTLATAALLLAGRVAAAGWPWIVSLLVKTNTALLAPVFVRLGAWRVLLSAALLVGVLNVPYFVARPGEAQIFWNENFGGYFTPPANRLGAFESGNLGLSGLVTALWLARDDAAVVVPGWLSALVAATIVAISLAATFLPRSKNVATMLSVWISAYFILYVDVWEHHYVMLLPAFALLVTRVRQLRLITLVVFVFVAAPTPFYIFEHTISGRPADAPIFAPELFWPSWAGIAYHASKAVPVLVLWAAVCCSALASRSKGVELP